MLYDYVKMEYPTFVDWYTNPQTKSQSEIAHDWTLRANDWYKFTNKPQLWLGSVKPSKAKFCRVTNRDRAYINNKPDGGLWTSTLDISGSSWVDFCKSEMPEKLVNLKRWVLKPSPDVNVWVIDNLSGLLEFHDRFPRFCQPNKAIDFEEASRYFDGIHLTENGQSETRFTDDDLDLYGWDCECTLWLNWSFI